MKLKSLNKEVRPREKASTYGIASLSNIELLALLIETGTSKQNVLELASALYSEVGSLKGLKRAIEEKKVSLKGLSQVKLLRFEAAFELAKRESLETSTSELIKGASDVYSLFASKLAKAKEEHLYLLLLNLKNRLLKIEEVAKGESLNFSLKNLLSSVLKSGASKIILVHNHPSGSFFPSEEDLEVTSKIDEAIKPFHILLMDHVIISSDGYFSFKAEGLLNNRKKISPKVEGDELPVATPA